MITKLFKLFLDSGIFPEQWSLGITKPIYKNSGDSNCPSSYRGITILSCLSNLFSNMLNDRLTRFIGPEQAGFRPGFSTIDHIFTLKTSIHIIQASVGNCIVVLWTTTKRLTQYHVPHCGPNF